MAVEDLRKNAVMAHLLDAPDHKKDIGHYSRLVNFLGHVYWMVCLGAGVVQRGWQSLIHRSERCDLSPLQLGLT